MVQRPLFGWGSLLLVTLGVLVLPRVHVALVQLRGPTYYHACVPARVRAFAARYTSGARAERQHRARQMEVLAELQRDAAGVGPVSGAGVTECSTRA